MSAQAVAERNDTAPVRVREGRAFLNLSQTQRRLAFVYRVLALEAEAAGRRAEYRKFRAESDRLWTEAKFHISKAKERLHG